MGKAIWDTDYFPVLYKFLELKDNMKVLDVGCGTGFYTRIIASQIKGEVIGVDIDEEFLEYARNNSKGLNIKYLNQNAYNLEFEENYFDLVTCQRLLCVLKDPQKALKEMIRVSKNNIVAIEPYNTVSIEYCEDKKFIELRKIIENARLRNEKHLENEHIDFDIGIKVPSMFYKNGLKNIEAKGYMIVVTANEKENAFDFELKRLKNFLTEDEFDRVMKYYKPPKGSLYAKALFIVKGKKYE